MRKRKGGAVSTSRSAEERESHAETLFVPIGNEGNCKVGILLLHDSFALIFPYPTEKCQQFLFLTLVQTRQDKVEVSNLYFTSRRKEEKCWGSPPQSSDGRLLFLRLLHDGRTDPTSSVSSCLRKFILYIMSYTDRTFGQKKPFALLPPYASFSFIPRQCPYVPAYSVQSYSKRTVTLPPHVSFLKSLWESPFHGRKQISWKSHGLSKKSQIREGDVR